MPTLTFTEARESVLSHVRGARRLPATEKVHLSAAAGRVLAEDVAADRDSPAVSRSVRDGYAVRAVDLPGDLEIVGEVRAGERFAGEVGPGQAVEIMTGAPVPAGADAVVMIEHTHRNNGQVTIGRAAEPRQNINPQGCEAAAHQVVLHRGKRLDYTDVAMLATFGHERIAVYQRPRVALIATGDEIVEVNESPKEFQIRNSNIYSLAAQVERAGGVAVMLAVARDNPQHTRARSSWKACRPICCCCPAAFRRASTTLSSRSYRNWAPNSISIGCSSSPASRWFSAARGRNSSSACRATPLPPW